MNGSHILAAGVGLVVVGAVIVAAPVTPTISLLVLGPVASLLVGAVAAHRAAANAETSPASAGVWSGLAVGVGAWIGTAVAVWALGLVVVSDRWMQDLVGSSQLLISIVSILAGLVVGVYNLSFATVGGLIGTAIGTRRPTGSRVAAR